MWPRLWESHKDTGLHSEWGVTRSLGLQSRGQTTEGPPQAWERPGCAGEKGRWLVDLGFVELLEQRSTDLVALISVDLLPGSSGGHKPTAGSTGPRSRCWQDRGPFWRLRGNPFLAFPASGDTRVAGLVAPSSQCSDRRSCSLSPWQECGVLCRSQEAGSVAGGACKAPAERSAWSPGSKCWQKSVTATASLLLPSSPTEAGEGRTTGVWPWWLERAEEARERGPDPGGCGQELGWAVGQTDQRLPRWDQPQSPEPWPGLLWL